MAAEDLQINKRNKSWVVNTIGSLFILLAVLSICTLISSHTYKTDGNIFLSISKFTVYLILILAGILYIKRQIFSRWLLICTIPIIIIKPLGWIFLAVFHLFSGTFDVIGTFFYPANILLLIYLITLLLLAILLLIHVVHWRNDFKQSNDKGIYLVSKILAFLSPGLGSVSQGKLWVGFALYFIYVALQSILNSNGINCSPGDSCLGENVIIILFQIAIWSGFNQFDSDYIDKTIKKAKSSPHEELP
jgi:hypothetical protein